MTRVMSFLGLLGCLGLLTALPAASAVTAGQTPTIVDRAGRTIPVESPFQRIISLYGAHTENLCALGLTDRLIGVSANETFPPRARRKPAFSYHDGPERFLAADPDLILIRPMIDRGYAKLISRLESAGITVVSLQPKTPEEMLDYWRTLGRLTGRPDEAEDLIQTFRNGVERARSLTADLQEPKQVYFEAIHEQMKTFSPESMAMFALRTAGGDNVAQEARTVRGTNIAAYGKERILAKAEAIDVYLAQRGPMNRPTEASIKNEPGFGIIRAVKNENICIVKEELVSRPTLRLLLGAVSIGRCLYPQRFDAGVEDSFQDLVNRAYSPE